MKKLVFETEQEFLSALDGKVYAITDSSGKFLCDVLEEDYLKLRNELLCVNFDDIDERFLSFLGEKDWNKRYFSQYVLVTDLSHFEEVVFKELWGVEIIIKEKKEERL